MNSRLIALIRKEFIQIRRDPRTLVILLLIPIMQLFLLGYAATNDVRNVPLAVFDQDRGVEARKLLEAYRAADYFRLAYEVDSEAELRDLIDRGSARAGLIIPPDFTAQIQGNGSHRDSLLPGWHRPDRGLHRPLGRTADRPVALHAHPGRRAPSSAASRSASPHRWKCAPRSGTTPTWSALIS